MSCIWSTWTSTWPTGKRTPSDFAARNGSADRTPAAGLVTTASKSTPPSVVGIGAMSIEGAPILAEWLGIR